jgi:WD repeat-containing protein 19
VFFYAFDPTATNQTARKIGEKQYPGIVEEVKVSEHYVAALMAGKVVLHTFVENPARPQKSFPDKETGVKITCQGMTENFYMCASAAGVVTIFSLMDHQVVTEYRHICGIRSLAPNAMGTRIFWVDVSNAGFVFNPSTEVAITVDNFSPTTEKVLWDPSDYGTVIGVDAKQLTSYVYAPTTRFGATCNAMIKYEGDAPIVTPRPYGFNPILVFRGIVICQMPTGTLAPVPLVSHSATHFNSNNDAETFYFNLQLNRVSEALAMAVTPEQLNAVAEKALHLVDVDMAIRVYRQLNRPTLVQCLESIRHIQEKNILLGHICLFSHKFTDAQNFFIRSSNPTLALDMRRDMMHWDQALELAQTLAPEQVPLLSRESAQQLEFRGEINSALEMFNKAHMTLPRVRENHPGDVAALAAAKAHNDACQGGSARCMVRIGNVRGGMQVALASGNKTLCFDCASILEGLRQFEEAAQLFEQAEFYEQAASIYIKDTKQLKAAQKILPKIKSRNILVMYAKAKETEGDFQGAEQAYELASDYDSVVRIKVEFLNDLLGAYAIVRRTRSTEAASMVAKVCRKRNEISAAVEFLLLAKKTTEAFDVAKGNDAMGVFETALLQQVTLKDGVAPQGHRENFILIAQHYEALGKQDLAGDFFQVGGNFTRALAKFLEVGTEEYVHKAITVVGRARSDALTHKLLDYLMGEADGEPKDPNFIFRLYQALKNYEKMAKTAVIISNKEQEMGNYREARKMLLDTCLILQEKGIRVTNDLRRALILVHSYLIVNHLVKPMDDNVMATRMLLRIARNIQKFPRHMAAILTSTVIRCIKTDFKASAYQYSCQLVQTEALRAEIPEKQKKKIEAVVRKRGKEELQDVVESTSMCPFCQAPVLETSLECGACKHMLPMCIVTGKHMVIDDWSSCPNCKFTALFTPFLKLMRDDPRCPLCDFHVNPMTLTKDQNPDLKQFS